MNAAVAIAVALLLLLHAHAPAAAALAGAAPPAPADGERHRVTFTEPNPLSGLAEYCRRTRQSVAAYEREGNDHAYTIANESFEIIVPAACTAENPHGVLVWVSPGRADLPRDSLAALAKRKLIWVSPTDAGNERHFVARIGLALDAVHNVKASYPVDESRVFISGFSGGGRVSSLVALTYPDVVTGAMPMMGCNFYRQLPAGDGKAFRATAAKPIAPLFTLAKKLPLVLVTSERDANQPQTKANFEAFKKDGFRHVSYIEVPGIGHTLPTVDWFENGLAQLDEAAAATAKGAKKPTKPTTRTLPNR